MVKGQLSVGIIGNGGVADTDVFLTCYRWW